MSTDIDVIDAESEVLPESDIDRAFEAYNKAIEDAYCMSPEDFAAKSAKDRDVVLFLLMRDMAGEVRALNFKVREFEEKAVAMASPEGIKELTDKFLGGMGGGMFKGLLG
jgi:hypothetical protein